MKKKLIILFLISLLFIGIVSIFNSDTSIYAATDCMATKEELQNYKQQYIDAGCPASNPTLCANIKDKISQLETQYDRECGGDTQVPGGSEGECEARFYFDKMGNYYKIDGTQFYVWKIYDAISNELMFCIEPGAMLRECDPYIDDPNYDLSYGQMKKVAAAIYFYNQQPSNDHYVAVTLWMWEVINGQNMTVNGRDLDSYWSQLRTLVDDLLNGTDTEIEKDPNMGLEPGIDGDGGLIQEIIRDVDFEEDVIYVDLNEDISVSDTLNPEDDEHGAGTEYYKEYDLNSDDFYIEESAMPWGSDNQDPNPSSENVTIDDGNHSTSGNLKNIWPSSKTVKVEPYVDSETIGDGQLDEDGNIIGDDASATESGAWKGHALLSTSSQDVLSFGGQLKGGTGENDEPMLTMFKYIGDEYTVKLKLGQLDFTKVDEWSQNAKAGHKYQVWYAIQNNEGTAIDNNGIRWNKYTPFVTEADWNQGLTQSTFITDENGKFFISDLPSGGKWNDGTPIGTYIIQEVDTTNPYQLNAKEYVFSVAYNSTTSLTVMNHERIVELVINKYDVDEKGDNHHMNDTDLLLNDAEYSVFDISDVREDIFGEDDKRLYTNYFIKVNNETNLKDLFSKEYEEVKLAHDNIEPIIKPSVTHCDKYEYDEDTSIFKANEIDTVEIIFVNPNDKFDVWYRHNLYIISSDNEICTDNVCTIDGFRQFKGYTGTGTVQLVDVLNHHLPIVNGWLTVYFDEACSKPYGKYQADEFGVIDFRYSYFEVDENVEVNNDGDGIYYYQLIEEKHTTNDFSDKALGDSLEGYYYSNSPHIDHIGQSEHINIVTYSISDRELLNGKDANKGELIVPNLHHSRTYLICESDLPDNYDAINTENTCMIYATDDNKYPSGTDSFLVDKHNEKVTGDLDLIKLNEWYDPDDNNVSFKLYHAALKLWQENDAEGIYDFRLDNRNDYDLNYQNVIYCDYEYSYDKDRNVCVYDGQSEITDNPNIAYQPVSLVKTKNNYPIFGEPVINPETGDNIFTADDNGKIYLADKLHYGYYILQEYDEGNPYEYNSDFVLFYIGHDGIETIKFTNTNRTVSFEVYKEDKENSIRINGAEYTVWDISDTLDVDREPTDTGEDGDLDYGDHETSSPYFIEDIHFAIANRDVDLYNLLIKDTALETKIANRPIYYELNDYSDAYISEDGILHASKPNYLTVDIYGGYRPLYGTASNITVYQNTVFDPYANLKFYADPYGNEPIFINSIEYSSDISFTTASTGKYTLTYTLTTDEHITYRFDRVINVIADNRHYCKYDINTDTYIWNDTKEMCSLIDVKDDIENINQPIVRLTNDSDYTDDGWYGAYIYTFNVVVLLDDQNLIDDINNGTNENIDIDTNEFYVDGIEVYKGKTGHKYIQTVDYENHNLPLANKEVVIYYDSECKYPFRSYISNNLGMVDLNEDEYTILAPFPEVQTDRDGNKYIISAQKTEYINGQTGEVLESRWETITIYLNDTTQEGLPKDENIDYVYYKNPYTDRISEIALTQQDGRLEMNTLKADRTYLVCETKLPDGYKYSEKQDVCFVLDTSEANYGYDDFDDKIENFNGSLVGGTRYNELRKIDVAIYKYNENKTIKLNGALFDVYDVLNEGEDNNHITNEYGELNVHLTQDNIEYLGDSLGATDKRCADKHYVYDEKAKACVISDNYIYTNTGNTIEDWKQALNISADNIEVYLMNEEGSYDFNTVGEYRLYFKLIESLNNEDQTPEDIDIAMSVKETDITRILVVTDEEIKDTVEYEELSTCNQYVKNDTPRSSLLALDENGHYLEKGEGGMCYIKYTPANVKRTYLGRYVSGGIYIRDFEAEYVEVATDENMRNVIKKVYLEDNEAIIMGLDDGIYYTQLSNSSEVISHFVAEGMIYLPKIPYGHELLVHEVQAPSGYWFDENDEYMTINPIADYGIHRIDNYRFNKAVIIPQLSVHIQELNNVEALESVFLREEKIIDYFNLMK